MIELGEKSIAFPSRPIFAPPFRPSVIVVIGELIEIRAYTRDLRSWTDPENVSGGTNVEKSAKPIRTPFYQVQP